VKPEHFSNFLLPIEQNQHKAPRIKWYDSGREGTGEGLEIGEMEKEPTGGDPKLCEKETGARSSQVKSSSSHRLHS